MLTLNRPDQHNSLPQDLSSLRVLDQLVNKAKWLEEKDLSPVVALAATEAASVAAVAALVIEVASVEVTEVVSAVASVVVTEVVSAAVVVASGVNETHNDLYKRKNHRVPFFNQH